MSGGKKTSRMGEILFKLSLLDSFRKDIFDLRKKLDIPTNGFANEEERLKWLTPNIALVLTVYEMELLKKYNIPPASSVAFSNYIYFDGRDDGSEWRKQIFNNNLIVLDTHGHLGDRVQPQLDNLYTATGYPFVKLYVLDGATRKDVQSFVKDNWKKIQHAMDEQRQTDKPRIRKTIYKDHIRRVIELSKKSSTELGVKKGEYRYIVISRILKEEGIDMKSDHVKKIITDIAKLNKR